MINRNYIIDWMKSRSIKREEFNYEKLRCPFFIRELFTPQDLADLNYLATSLKLTAKPVEKFNEIDAILRSRGFKQFINGTNRVCYEFIEDKSFLCKVAYNNNSRSDSLNEFKNQFFIKPFCSKMFETTPDGVLAFLERVNPITSREEYLSVIGDIYYLLYEWLLKSGYVFDDLGTEKFMNIGIRPGFGPVLIDYPYIFPIDPNSIFCSAPDPTSPTGCCEGEITMDPGLNMLYCTKCGAKYRARELAKYIENDNIILKKGKVNAMKFTVSGGSKSVTKENQMVDNSPKMVKSVKNNENKPIISTNRVERKVEEPKPEPECPVTFDESLKGAMAKADAEAKEKEERMKVIDCRGGIATIEGAPSTIENYSITKIEEMLNVALEDKDTKGIKLENFLTGIFKIFVKALDKFEDDSYEKERVVEYEFIKEILSDSSNIFKRQIIKFLFENDFFIKLRRELDYVYPVVRPRIEGSDSDIFDINVPFDSFKLDPDEKIDIQNMEESDNDKMVYFAGEIRNAKDLNYLEHDEKVIVLIGSDGKPIRTTKGSILAIDKLDDRNLSKIKIVAKSYFDKITENMPIEPDEEDVKRYTEQNNLQDNSDVNYVRLNDVPIGVMPPESNMGVNGR